MACNCKKKLNDRYNEGDDGHEKKNFFGIVFNKFLNVLFYFMAVVLSLVSVPFAIIAVFLYGAFGKKLQIRIPFVNKIKREEKTDAGNTKIQD